MEYLRPLLHGLGLGLKTLWSWFCLGLGQKSLRGFQTPGELWCCCIIIIIMQIGATAAGVLPLLFLLYISAPVWFLWVYHSGKRDCVVTLFGLGLNSLVLCCALDNPSLGSFLVLDEGSLDLFTRFLLKVRAGGRRENTGQTRASDALASRRTPLTCPNKTVELGRKQSGEDEILDRCVCLFSTCVYFSCPCASNSRSCVEKAAGFVLKARLNVCIFVCVCVCEGMFEVVLVRSKTVSPPHVIFMEGYSIFVG